MNFYQSAGSLVLGSRLRRIGEKFLSEVAKVYEMKGIDFDPSWFPIFYLLDKNTSMSLREISDELGVSHSAVSQLTTALIKKGHLLMEKDINDGRKRILQLTPQGESLVETSKPIWSALQASVKELSALGDNRLLEELTTLENSLSERNLSDRVLEKLK
ncbi:MULTISPECIES: MarR family winged helix-turn-helix transcriptional regulator [Flammeovirga]|uniref:Winged helix-turn-helix transcriptional regulator n=1 Tax=Flammeovirga agarivorans TaxID=2726742 RepID=A0A7X8SM74_9BACT|nr:MULTISPECIES: MarR family winged helix-turn-helix transcriptional regulator [Flammeovirga]NLR92740.1 winged helix-turn-helix transcriptional regulator [Flammeovirga agarivorans]